jgi:hypothetical protein
VAALTPLSVEEAAEGFAVEVVAVGLSVEQLTLEGTWTPWVLQSNVAYLTAASCVL